MLDRNSGSALRHRNVKVELGRCQTASDIEKTGLTDALLRK